MTTNLSTTRLLSVAAALVGVGTLGFRYIDGLISEDAEGNEWVNAFYCAVITMTTVGYGDVCPSEKLDNTGRLFIVALSLCGLGMFCGPVMDFASSWTRQIPGGAMVPSLVAVWCGALLFTQLEGMDLTEAIYFTIITGTTVGYGDLGPQTNYGRIATALL